MSLTPQWMDELRSRISLSGVIGRSVRVTKAGREFKACCPFHNEKTPSFTINDEKGFYHCFGCGEHGNVFDFVMKTEGLSFPELLDAMPAALREALEELEKDHEFLLGGDVFTKDQLEGYMALKWEEVYAYEHTPHPIEYQMYYSS